MSKSRHLILVFLLLTVSWYSGASAQTSPNLGTLVSQEELTAFDITVYPDGRNLPRGNGSALEGKQLYEQQCQMCHGPRGIEGPAARLAGGDGWFSFSDPLRILRIKDYPILLVSVGGMWPYATSIFDYIRRAMPHYAPKSLSNDQVYALTAYLLYLNNLLEEDANLDHSSILKIEMPGLLRSPSLSKDPSQYSGH